MNDKKIADIRLRGHYSCLRVQTKQIKDRLYSFIYHSCNVLAFNELIVTENECFITPRSTSYITSTSHACQVDKCRRLLYPCTLLRLLVAAQAWDGLLGKITTIRHLRRVTLSFDLLRSVASIRETEHNLLTTPPVQVKTKVS
ncbi:hypothetical protein K1T71_012895 [Dendrolimus kikuchii]|uniref:Uncharacterized protein n=1 Tax=Dendrolimus kikuchii TaxID=765133 RepID=A0ACC1CID8_9NEOP|nr:hypothetical protein K1T71_012895 [Dendrolimus kikuchii]